MSKIEWTDVTWNPVTGCTKVSPGCDNCYAEREANTRVRHHYLKRLPVVEKEVNDPFAVRLWPERLDQPRRWSQKPRMIFVNSMSDLFHADIPHDFLCRIFRVMMENPQHIYQVLTKRPARARRFWLDRGASMFGTHRIPGHIWMGTSVEDQRVAYRIDHLMQIPAEVRFLSCEPLIGPLDLDRWVFDRDEAIRLAEPNALSRDPLDWVIVGGESGPNHRPMRPEWVRAIRDQCVAAGVSFFFKQWGGRTPKAGGRTLDGRTWDEWPLWQEGNEP